MKFWDEKEGSVTPRKEFIHSGESSPGKEGSEFCLLPLNKLRADPDQPRKSFDSEGLTSLSESLKRDGFLQPLVVRPRGSDGFYLLIAGERRLRAAKLAGLKEVPVHIRPSSESAVKRLALVENIQRRDLNVVEEARAYQELIESYGYTHEGCAKELGVDRTKVTNALRVLSLPGFVQRSLMEGSLSMGHGRALLSLKESPQLVKEGHRLVLEKGLSVRQTEALCKRLLAADKSEASFVSAEADPNVEYLEDSLRQRLKTKVRLVGSGVRGKIEISYFSPAEFERILSALGLS